MKITKNGKDLDPSLYTWDEKNKTLSILISGCTIDCGADCTIKCGDYCTINCRAYCTINCRAYCTINCGCDCTINSKGNKVIVINRSFYGVIELGDGDRIMTLYDAVYKKIEDKLELTLDEVADKFGVNVENLKIRK